MFTARNREFFRDRAAFGWNFLFPFLLIAGFAIIFSGDAPKEFKVGVFPCPPLDSGRASHCVPDTLARIRLIQYIPFADKSHGLERLKHHKIDMLIHNEGPPHRYWINETAPKGYTVSRMVIGSLTDDAESVMARQEVMAGRQVRYIDWLFPGIIGMNMMFSALYGVGFVVVRYRKNGVLKRLQATPLTAFEYLSAQMLSRLFVLVFSTSILWIGCHWIFNFSMAGSYLDLFIVFLLGSLSLITLGLIIAARVTSEELATGVLNFLTWPMMFLSEVWFSIEGAPDWVKGIAQAFPLTHLLRGVRKIVNDGASLADIGVELAVLSALTLLFLSTGAALFAWNK